MKIVRTSSNFPAYLEDVGLAAVFEGAEKVSIGFRQEKTVDASGNETFENVEVFGDGQASYSCEWPDDWGAPPSEQDLDGWVKAVPVEALAPTIPERLQVLTKAFNTLAVAYLEEGGDETSPSTFLRFVSKSK